MNGLTSTSTQHWVNNTVCLTQTAIRHRRLRTQLVTKDQDIALLAAKIFETIKPPAHRIPIIHYASVAVFPAYPSLDVL